MHKQITIPEDQVEHLTWLAIKEAKTNRGPLEFLLWHIELFEKGEFEETFLIKPEELTADEDFADYFMEFYTEYPCEITIEAASIAVMLTSSHFPTIKKFFTEHYNFDIEASLKEEMKAGFRWPSA